MVSHWFDSGAGDEPYTATVRLTGRRVGIRGMPRPGDTFAQEETVEDVIPGTGPVSVTSWVYGLRPGEWTVRGDLSRPAIRSEGSSGSDRARRRISEQLAPALWSWRRWSVSTAPPANVKTRWARLAPLARVPGVMPGSWPALGSLAVVVALAMQAVILAHEGVSFGPSLGVSLLALVAGLIGAKVWYAVLHPGPWPQALLGGWSVDGFFLVSPVVAIVASLALGLPIGRFLDASAPGLFLGVAIGRLGCFFTGCCAGRCTSSRWGIWSSDQRVGARRIPAQFLESAAGFGIGLASALLILNDVPTAPGLVFVGASGAYILVRQFLLRLRAERRQYSWRRSGLATKQRS